MKNHTPRDLVVILFLCCVFLICPVSSYVVGTTIEKGASVYIGEQGLNITHTLNQGSPHAGTIDDVPVNKSIGWWSAGSPIDTVAPTKIIDTSAFYKSLTISPIDFVGYTGSWYVLNETTGKTASGAADSGVFIVTDPSLDLSIWDFTSSTDVTGTYVPRGDYIGLRITTNLYNSLNYTYRSPIYNTTSDGYIDIKVKNQSGVVYTSLLNSSALASSLLQHNVSYTPWTWGNAPSAPFNWSTGVTSAGQSVYLTGNYSVFAESQLNGMKDNYKDSSGADYTGKTVSQTYYMILYESPLADFSATPVSGIAPLTVQFTDSSSGPPSGWSWNFGDGSTSTTQNTTHTYITAGTYTVFLTATNPGGSNTRTRTGYITVSAPAPTPSGRDSDGTAPGPAPVPEQKVEVKEVPVVAQPPQVQQQQQPAAPQQLVPATPETQPVEGLAGVTVAESYPVGFVGMSYNTDGQNSVSIDISSAEQAHATVTTFFDHVEVYQHGSPGVRISFYFDKYDLKDDIITGTAKRAEFVTDPLTVNVSTGKVSGSVQAVLISIDKPVKVENIITGDIPLTTAEDYSTLLAQDNQSVAGIAYLMKFHRGNLTSTGAANVTMTVPLSWVVLHGGKDAVKITRTSDETGMTELLKTIYIGPDSGGNMVFRGDSPHGTSIFGLVTAKATAVEKQAHPNETYIPASKPAMITNVGMFGWIFGIIFDNPVLIVVPIAVFIVALYSGWWKKRL